MFKLNRKIKQAGMSYVELIVVLSIFAAMSGIAIFNYGGFQDKVDIKNMASDIASKIVEAQRSALAGQWPPVTPSNPDIWKPSYGVYFLEPVDSNPDHENNKNFIYFTDLNSDRNYLGDLDCADDECLNKISITKNNYISKIEECENSNCDPISNNFSLTFTRPNSQAVLNYENAVTAENFEYMSVTISSLSSEVNAVIKIYASGRVQVD